MNIWFSSDFHYHHKNICSGTSKWGDESRTRPFETLEDMDNTIVEHINKKVKPTVFDKLQNELDRLF